MIAGIEALITSGQLFNLIVGLIALEAAGLWWLDRRGKLPTRFSGLLPNLISGAILMLAVKQAILGQDWRGIALLLLLALVAHLVDLGVRLRPQSQ